MAESLKTLGKRLEATRLALKYESQVEFCTQLHIDKSEWNHFEKGRRRITLKVAVKLKQRFSIPLDWTYCADPSALPGKIYPILAPLAA